MMSEDGEITHGPASIYPSEMEETELAAHIALNRAQDVAAAGEWREEARAAYEMCAGRQWDAEDAATLREQGRPPVTFDRISPMIDAICGAQVNNRQEMKFLPRSGDDGGKSEIIAGVVRWVRDQCDAEDEESEAFRDVVICGMGWTETRMDYENSYDPAGMIVEERVDPFEMGWDRAARKRNLADAGHVHRRQQLPITLVETRWPEFADVAKVGRGLPPDAPTTTVMRPARDAYGDGDDSTPPNSDVVEVTHFQWCERRKIIRVLNDLTGEIQELDPEQWEALKERVGEDAADTLQHVEQTEKKWFQAFECGGKVADVGPCPDPKGPTFKCITGRRDRNKRVFYGIVRAVMDPQKWANKWLSQSMHILNTSAKSGVLAEDGALLDQRKFEESYAKTGSVTLVAPGALSGGRVIPKTAAGFPAGMDRLLQFAIQSIPDVTGVNREMLGTVDREQAGVLEAQRKQASQAVLAPMFDSLRRFYKDQGRLLLTFVQQYIPPDKVIRIMTPDGDPQSVQMAMLPDAADFDIVIDQAPTSPNQKTEVWAAMAPMLPVLVKEVPPPILLDLLKFSPLPESVVKGIQEKIAQLPPPPPDPAAEKAKADMAMKQADMQMNMAMKQADMQQAEKMAALEFETKRREAEFDMQMSRMKAEQDMAIARMQAEFAAQVKAREVEVTLALDARKAEHEATARVESMKADREILAQPVADVVAPLRELVASIAETQRDIAQASAEQAAHLAELIAETRRMVMAPKEVVRGPDGRVSGARIAALN